MLLLGGDGKVQAQGPIESTLTAENLQATFGLEFELRRDAGRFFATAQVEAL